MKKPENRFKAALILLSGVSEEYASAAWYTLSSAEQQAKTPELAARNYVNRFFVKKQPRGDHHANQ